MVVIMLGIGMTCGALLLASVAGPQPEPAAQEISAIPTEHNHQGLDNGATIVPRGDERNEPTATMPSASKEQSPEKGKIPEGPVTVAKEQSDKNEKKSESDQEPQRSNNPSNRKQISLSAAAGSIANATSADPTTDPFIQNPVSKSLGSQTPRNRQSGHEGKTNAELPSRKPIDPSTVLDSPLSGSPGGCLKAYGKNGQCLPTVPPSQAAHVRDMIASGQNPSSMQHSWTCKELKTIFADGIKVRVSGEDPQKLDRNGDGLACGRGD